MFAVVATVWSLLLGAALIMIGNGLLGTLLGVRATAEQFPTAVTGLVMTGYYVGFLAGSLLAPRAVQRVGHVRVYAALASLVAAAALAHALFVNPVMWGMMRMVTGFAYAGLYIVAESWLNDRGTNQTRGQLLSIYMIIQFGGLTLGQLLLNLADPVGFELFSLVAILLTLAVPTMLLAASRAPSFEAPAKLGLARLFRISPLGVLGCLGVGIAHSAFFGMGAVYTRESGLSLRETSIFMAVAIVGGVVAQWPVGLLSDRIDRRIVIVATTFLAAGAAFGAAVASGVSPTAVLALACLFGAMSLPLYSLVIAHTNDLLQPEEMVPASSSLMLVFGIGAVVGPAIAGLVMSAIGPVGFFLYLGTAQALIGVIALYRMARRGRPDAETRTPFQPTPPSPTPMTATLAAPDEAVNEPR